MPENIENSKPDLTTTLGQKQLLDTMEEMLKEMGRLQKELDSLKNSRREDASLKLSAELEETRRELQSSKESISILQAELAKSTATLKILAGWQGGYSDLGKRLSKLSELESENASMQSALSGAQAQLKTDSTEIRKAEDTIKLLRNQLELMQEKETATSSMASEGQQALFEAYSALEEADKKIRTLASENARLRLQISDDLQAMHEAAIQMSELSSTNERLLDWLEGDLGIGDLLAREEDEWRRLRAERTWIERFWAQIRPPAGRTTAAT